MYNPARKLDESLADLENLYKIVVGDTYFEGLLVPDKDYVRSFGKAALGVSGYVRTSKDGTDWSCKGGIFSANYSSANLEGPWETELLARKKLAAFREFVQERHPRMPDFESLLQFSYTSGLYLYGDDLPFGWRDPPPRR